MSRSLSIMQGPLRILTSSLILKHCLTISWVLNLPSSFSEPLKKMRNVSFVTEIFMLVLAYPDVLPVILVSKMTNKFIQEMYTQIRARKNELCPVLVRKGRG